MRSENMLRRNSSTTSISRFSFFISIFLLFTIVAATDNNDDADCMLRFFQALTVTPPGWSNNTHFCKWTGVVCNESSNRVHTISLPSTSLTGTLPPDLNTLSNLIHLDLHNNSLTGPLPILTRLKSLQTVYLGHNNFNSTPDGCFKLLTALQTLNLSNNLNLQPWIFPVDMDRSSLLQTLDLEATHLIGPLRTEIFHSFPSLETVFLSHNNLTGTLPSSLGRSRIRYLRLNNQGNPGTLNSLTGNIHVISSMRFLSQAWLNNNSFTGHIPDLSNCTHLFDLQLHSNALSGAIPPSLMALNNLKNVSLDDNTLQGPIPMFRGVNVKATFERNSFCRRDVGPCDPRVMTLLEIAADFGFPDLVEFGWTGNDPCMDWGFIGCTRGKIITSFDMRNVDIGGTISPAFSNLKDLVNLTLSGINLTGSIPHSFTTLPRLQLLDVSDNNLSGKVPKFPPIVNLITRGNALLGKETVSPRHNALNGEGSSKTPNATSSLRPLWIAGALVFSVGVLILMVIICRRKRYYDLVQKMIFMKTRKGFIGDNVEDFIKRYDLSVAKRYSYAEVKKITNSFQDKLGHGGYGVVYKGKLSDGRQVAVKVINESKGDGEEFINEVASISRTLHVNIVSLLGFSYEMNKRALIYEFMPNGSLDKFIYKSGFSSAICSLDWNTLYQIAIGIARGLEYLHQGCISRILHLDIKPQNILLDEDFCPKISDFGLAKICQQKDSIVSILGTRGTIGFIAPEVFSRTFGGVSHKSDVYSYGMLILEMIGGRKNYDTGESNTTEMYFSNWINKDLELTDSLANGLAISEEEKDTVRKVSMVSLWCIQTNPLDRPSMSKVIEMLQGPLQSIPYPPKPVLYTPQCSSLQSSSMSSKNLLETNQ